MTLLAPNRNSAQMLSERFTRWPVCVNFGCRRIRRSRYCANTHNAGYYFRYVAHTSPTHLRIVSHRVARWRLKRWPKFFFISVWVSCVLYTQTYELWQQRLSPRPGIFGFETDQRRCGDVVRVFHDFDMRMKRFYSCWFWNAYTSK